jgi:transcriptional regulator with XRE-family HTH domain
VAQFPDKDNMGKFALNLKAVIKARGMTAKQVSDATGIPRTTLSEWINGREPTASEVIIKLSRFLGVSVEYLITGREPEVDLVNEIIGHGSDEYVSIHKGVYRISIEKKITKKDAP